MKALLEENARLGAEIVKMYLKGETKGGDKVRIAQQSITQFHKFRSTEGATDALRYQMLRDVSGDRKELKGYIKASFPVMNEVVLIE